MYEQATLGCNFECRPTAVRIWILTVDARSMVCIGRTYESYNALKSYVSRNISLTYYI